MKLFEYRPHKRPSHEDGLPTEKSRSLFAYLLLHHAPHAWAHLAGLFWPDLPEKTARRRLTQELWRIGSELEKTGVNGAPAPWIVRMRWTHDNGHS
jgi:DNA-binding SARP family transcriptional activator